MGNERLRCAISCIAMAMCLVQSHGRVSRRLQQTAFGVDSSGSPTAWSSSTVDYFDPHWGASFMGSGSPSNSGQWAPAANPENSSAIFFISTPGEIRYTVSLQAVMPPYDRVEKVQLVGSVSSDTGERPVIAYLFGVEAMSLFQTNETASGVSAPTYLANAQAPWQIASGVIYPEDITDDSPYLFSEIPGRLTGSYSGYNEDPLFVLVQTTSSKEAFIAGIDNGIKPLNAAALQYVDQDTIGTGDSSDSSSDSDSEGQGSLTASGGNAPASAAAPAGNITAASALMDPSTANGTPEPAAAPSTSIVASAGAPAGGPATAPAAAPAGADSSAAVAYGASTFHVDLAASPGISTNSSGLVMFFLSPMESSMHYRMYLRGLSPFALIQNVTFYATDGPDSTGVDRLILTKAFGMPNGPSNPSGGFGVPANGTTWVITTGNSPDETVLSVPGNGDLEMSRYRQFSNALRYNKLRVHLTTVVHPDGLLDGISAVGTSKGNWPVPSW